MLQGGVGGQNGVVRLDDGGGGLGGGVDTELELALLSVVNREALHEQSTETRTGATTKGVEDKEALEAGAAVGNPADLVEDTIDKLLTDGVVTTSVVVGSILLAANHVLGVEQASVGAGSDLVDHIGLEIAVDGSRDVLALACFGNPTRQMGFVTVYVEVKCLVPVSEKKVLKPWSGSAALRSSVRKPSGCQGRYASVVASAQYLGLVGNIPECRARDSIAKSTKKNSGQSKVSWYVVGLTW